MTSKGTNCVHFFSSARSAVRAVANESVALPLACDCASAEEPVDKSNREEEARSKQGKKEFREGEDFFRGPECPAARSVA